MAWHESLASRAVSGRHRSTLPCFAGLAPVGTEVEIASIAGIPLIRKLLSELMTGFAAFVGQGVHRASRVDASLVSGGCAPPRP